MQQRSEPHEIVTISEAKVLGLRWYFTGEPCPRGHIAKRSLSNRDCRGCVDARKSAKRIDEPDVVRAKDRARHNRSADARREQSRQSYRRNIEKRHEYERIRYQEPDRRDWQKKQARDWAKANPGKRNRIIAARREWVKRATPKWLTEEDHGRIAAIYLEAASFGPGVMHVDHRIPLRGRLICGLHVPENLQIIPALDNIAKGNRYGTE